MFKHFIKSLQRKENKPLIEAILKGYSIIFESWKKPDLQEEMGEINRTIEDVKSDHVEISKGNFINSFYNAKLVDLTDDLWSQLENTDSWVNIKVGDVKKALKLGEEYDRNAEKIINGLKKGDTLPAPIVMKGAKDWYYLVAGNTRLMIARALGIRPKVLMVDVSEKLSLNEAVESDESDEYYDKEVADSYGSIGNVHKYLKASDEERKGIQRAQERYKTRIVNENKHYDIIKFEKKSGPYYILMHKSTKKPGIWQLTSIDDRGPMGDSEYKSKEDAILSAIGLRTYAWGEIGFVPVEGKTLSSLHESVSYPQGFDINELKNSQSFAGRIRYVQTHLKRIGAGSARIVYEIDDNHVLKLARNKKGIAQNYVEGDWGLHNMYDILPELIDADEDDLWLIVEKANKITKREFERLTGIKFEDFAHTVRYELARIEGPSIPWGKPEEYEEIIDDEFFQDIIDMSVNFDFPSGDFEKISSYGEIDNKPVAVDVGLTREGYEEFYKPKRF